MTRRLGIDTNGPIAVNALGDDAAVGNRSRHPQRGQVGVGQWIVRVARHVHLGRLVLLELVVTQLQPAGHQFDDEQAVGDVEGRRSDRRSDR